MNALIDLDGVLADFFTPALARLNQATGLTLTPEDYVTRHGTFAMDKVFGLDPKDFWEIIDTGDFWINLKPFPWTSELLKHFYIHHFTVTISSCPSYDPRCAAQKVEWCRHYLELTSSSLMLGGRKWLMARDDTILFDDQYENVALFRSCGGHAIQLPSNWNTLNLTYDKVKKATLL